MYIDSHQHFWQLNRGDYAWLTPQLKPLYRDFLPQDLLPTLNELQIQGTILVQAAPTIDETHFMLQLAKDNAFIKGVVGWVDMMHDDACDQIAMLKENPHFCGIRPMIQDIADDKWMLHKTLTPVFKLLEMINCPFDALVFPKHLPHLISLIEKHPDLKIVIDHGAKPPIKSREFSPWADYIEHIADFPNVYCKFSGLLTEAPLKVDWQDIIPYADHLFACFGDERMMWGSDFPVINLVSDYVNWFSCAKQYVQQLGGRAEERVFREVALQFYQGDST